MEPRTDPLAAVAALAEPLRRRLYEVAARRDGGVTRDAAATALGVARSVAAFHLDKLETAGLLEAEYRRPAGRSGPGAGRPAKWYRLTSREVTVSVPDRRYRLAAEVLADAAERALAGVPVEDAVRRAARAYGRRLGVPSSEGAAAPPADRLLDALVEHGYEPRREGGSVSLGNCPFDAVAVGHRHLVCGMNLELLRGLVETAGLDPEVVRLDPRPGRCCVTLAA